MRRRGDYDGVARNMPPLESNMNALPLPMSEPFTASIRTIPLLVKASLFFVSGMPARLVVRQLARRFLLGDALELHGLIRADTVVRPNSR